MSGNVNNPVKAFLFAKNQHLASRTLSIDSLLKIALW